MRPCILVPVVSCFLAACFATQPISPAMAQEDPRVPEILRPWIPWVLWDDPARDAPRSFQDASQRILHWPSRLKLQASANGGNWEIQVRVFGESWVALPGDSEHWPKEVTANEQPIVVVEHAGNPSVKLPEGDHRLQGKWDWKEMPQRVRIPRSYGMLDLTLEDQKVSYPNWDAEGFLWLKRAQVSEAEKDQFTLEIHRVIEDGSPIWLRTQLDITVSGKSREEDLGYILPESWQLSFVSSPIPVAIDETGRLKAQLRPGTWQIRIDAFRNQDLKEFRYAAGVAPAVASELIAVRAKPELRIAELQGATPVDVQLTRFPECLEGSIGLRVEDAGHVAVG
jgi:hypothetical protein